MSYNYWYATSGVQLQELTLVSVKLQPHCLPVCMFEPEWCICSFGKGKIDVFGLILHVDFSKAVKLNNKLETYIVDMRSNSELL